MVDRFIRLGINVLLFTLGVMVGMHYHEPQLSSGPQQTKAQYVDQNPFGDGFVPPYVAELHSTSPSTAP